MFKQMKKLFEVGFTLIEMLVVISIIGILAVLISANLNSARSRARDAERKSDLRNIETALRLYYNDEGAYPAASSSQIKACTSYSSPTACSWGSAWAVGSVTYMSKLPIDPLSPAQSYIYENSGVDTFTLTACLENTSDPNAVATALCSGSSGYGFQITP